MRVRLSILLHIVATGLFLLASARAEAPDDCRVAIVVGNSAYPDAPLLNPINDAKAMSAVLRNAGFTVFEVRNAGKTQMVEAIHRAGVALRGRRGVGMLYYAGHGIQLDWRDYMVPVDARLKNSADVLVQAVDLQEVIDVFRSAGTRTNILVLDACRDNPFGASATGKGLAPIDAPPGTLLAYATAPGNVAADGDSSSENGLYTQFLVRELGVPGARIEDVFKRVRYQVRRKSAGRQIPWETTSLEDDFYFEPDPSMKQTLDPGKDLDIQKADWDRVKDAGVPALLYTYLLKYPNGLVSEQAEFRLDQLQRPMLQVQTRDDTLKSLPRGADRFAVDDEFVFEVSDGFTGLSRKITHRVTSTDGDRVVVNDGAEIWDQMGGVLKNSSGVKNPAIVTSPADIAVGKKWRSGFTNTRPDGGRSDNFWDFRVVGLEDVSVPAGSFRAYRVERRGEAHARGRAVTFMSGTFWIDPQTMFVIKTEILFRTGGKIQRYERTQLVSYKVARVRPD